MAVVVANRKRKGGIEGIGWWLCLPCRHDVVRQWFWAYHAFYLVVVPHPVPSFGNDFATSHLSRMVGRRALPKGIHRDHPNNNIWQTRCFWANWFNANICGFMSSKSWLNLYGLNEKPSTLSNAICFKWKLLHFTWKTMGHSKAYGDGRSYSHVI